MKIIIFAHSFFEIAGMKRPVNINNVSRSGLTSY